MSSVAYNLWRKLEFMSRRLRHIDDVGKIKEWIVAMTAINRLLKEIDIKEYTDDWRPWGQRKTTDKALEKDIDEEEPAKGVKKTQGLLMPPLRLPTTRTKKTGIKDDGRMPFGDNDRGKKKQKLDPKAVRQPGWAQIKPPRVELVENAMDVAKAKDPEVQVETAN